jgi:hypothetical protein
MKAAEDVVADCTDCGEYFSRGIHKCDIVKYFKFQISKGKKRFGLKDVKDLLEEAEK